MNEQKSLNQMIAEALGYRVNPYRDGVGITGYAIVASDGTAPSALLVATESEAWNRIDYEHDLNATFAALKGRGARITIYPDDSEVILEFERPNPMYLGEFITESFAADGSTAAQAAAQALLAYAQSRQQEARP